MQHIFEREKVYKSMLHEDLADKEILNQMKMVRFLFITEKILNNVRNVTFLWTLLKLASSEISHMEKEMQTVN